LLLDIKAALAPGVRLASAESGLVVGPGPFGSPFIATGRGGATYGHAGRRNTEREKVGLYFRPGIHARYRKIRDQNPNPNPNLTLTLTL